MCGCNFNKACQCRKTLRDIGVSDYLDAVVYGNEVEHGKPEPDIFLLAAGAIGVKPENAIVVEDSINGIKAGHAAGMRVIHVPDTIAIDDEIRKLTYCVCNDLTEIVDIVDSINKPVINKRLCLTHLPDMCIIMTRRMERLN